MTKTFAYDLIIPDTSLRLSLEEITDPAAWEPLDRCAGEPYGDDEIGFQSDPDRGEWSGDAALEAAVSAHSHAIYWTVFEVLNQLAGALMPGALDAIEQQKRGGLGHE